MHLTIKRSFDTGRETLGLAMIDGIDMPPFATLEEPWRDNQRNISCIPSGVYRCTPHNGVRFKRVWRLESVPNRSAILIHAGNTVDDIEGCILLGMRHGRLNDKNAVLDSNKAIRELRKIIGVNNSFTITIL